jgi:hypothetical protein
MALTGRAGLVALLGVLLVGLALPSWTGVAVVGVAVSPRCWSTWGWPATCGG